MARSIRKLKSFIVEKLRNELPGNLTYHGVHHTLDVYQVCNQYIKRLHLSNDHAFLLRAASLLHDVGLIWTYSGHEEASIRFAWQELPGHGFQLSEIKKIEEMIRCTQIQQKPKNILEQIICDADLDYLGRNDVDKISNTLYQEFLAYKIVEDEESWDRLQVKFLTMHEYYTSYALKFRAPNKKRYLENIIKKWGWTL